MTVIKMIRKGGKGLKGTIANAKCHAQDILPFIYGMKDEVAKLGFAEWRQGNNVHEFRTHDDRRFTLRPFLVGTHYTGVRLSLRHSRSSETPLIDIESSADAPALLETMRLLALPLAGHTTRTRLHKAA